MGKFSIKSSEIAHHIVKKIKSVQDDAKITELNIYSSVEFATEANEQINKAHSYYMDIKDSIENVTKDSQQFFNSMENLEQGFQQVNEVVHGTDQTLDSLVLHTKDVLQAITSQLNNIDKINSIVFSTFKTSRILNSLISQFVIPGFKDISIKQEMIEELIEKTLSMRGIIVSLLYAKDSRLSILLKEEIKSIEHDLLDYIQKKRHLLKAQKDESTLKNILTHWQDYSEINKEIFQKIEQNYPNDAKSLFEIQAKPKLREIVSLAIDWLTLDS